MANRRKQSPAKDHAKDRTADYERIRNYTLTEIDRITDPNSPEYDPEEADRIREEQAITDNPLYDPERMAELKKAAGEISARTAEQGKRITAVIDTFLQEMARVREEWEGSENPLLYVREQDLQSLTAEYNDIVEKFLELHSLEPYILQELDKPEWRDYGFFDYTLQELLIAAEQDAYKTGPALILERAREAYNRDHGIFDAITAKRTDVIDFPLDKLNAPSTGIWKQLENAGKDGNGQLTFAMERRGSKYELNLYYSINFDALGKNLTISKRLTGYDRRVYVAAAALYNTGNYVTSLNQIYYAMGNPRTAKPSKAQLNKISESIDKMMGARITVDNSGEAAAYNYDHFVYEGQLLPAERVTAVINGQIADAAIHLFREPPVMTFARQRKQLTTIPIQLLQSPVNKTEKNLLIEDYLIERISRAKRSKHKTEVILFSKICEVAGITDKTQRKRALETIERYLNYQQQQGFFKRYSLEPAGRPNKIKIFI